jgi:hypothetical protein
MQMNLQMVFLVFDPYNFVHLQYLILHSLNQSFSLVKNLIYIGFNLKILYLWVYIRIQVVFRLQ